MRLTKCLLFSSALVVFTATTCVAEITKEFNGLTQDEVTKTLGAPTKKEDFSRLGSTNWYYNGLRITFKDGVISETDVYSRSSAAITTVPTARPAVPTYIPPAPPVPAYKPYTPTPLVPESNYSGRLSTNKYDADSVSNAYGKYGTKYRDTINNPYSTKGSEYSSTSPTNPYATNTPKLYAEDGTYLGKLSSNKYDPESISNPYGKYGNPYGNTINNPYSTYGSKYSSQSPNNPYATTAPKIYTPSPYTYTPIKPIEPYTFKPYTPYKPYGSK